MLNFKFALTVDILAICNVAVANYVIQLPIATNHLHWVGVICMVFLQQYFGYHLIIGHECKRGRIRSSVGLGAMIPAFQCDAIDQNKQNESLFIYNAKRIDAIGAFVAIMRL